MPGGRLWSAAPGHPDLGSSTYCCCSWLGRPTGGGDDDGGPVKARAWVGDEEPSGQGSGASGYEDSSAVKSEKDGDEDGEAGSGDDGEGESDEEESEYEIEQHDGSKKTDPGKAVKKTVKGMKSLREALGHEGDDGEDSDQDGVKRADIKSAHSEPAGGQGGKEDDGYDPDRARNYVA